MKELGQIAYEGFQSTRNPSTGGPAWETLTVEMRAAWNSGANAVVFRNGGTLATEAQSTLSVAKQYVVGFMFSHDRRCVALIRKEKPAWQAGKLNGIGGKLEREEVEVVAMVREFEEETGYVTTQEQWEHYLKMSGDDGQGGRFQVDFFATVGDLARLKSKEAEQVEIILTSDVNPLRPDMIDNCAWAIGLAMDCLHDGRPEFVTVNYPRLRGDGV
jgi:8-oxo-dGTP diphosphatase